MTKQHILEIDDLERICRQMFGDEYVGVMAGRDVLAASPQSMPVFIGLWNEAQVEDVEKCLTVQAGLVDIEVYDQLLMELLYNNKGPTLWGFSLEPVENGNHVAIYLEGTQILTPNSSHQLVRSYISNLCSYALEKRQQLVAMLGAKKLTLEFDDNAK